MPTCINRRDFIGLSLGGFAAVGTGAALVAMKGSWDPLPSVISAGFTTVDISTLKEGECKTVEWRGKPVYILKKTAQMTPNASRDVHIDGANYSIGVQICTHLGCIPYYESATTSFKCACHGGAFDVNGIQTFGPPPKPMEIPPFKIDGPRLVLGEEGAEYKKLVAKA